MMKAIKNEVEANGMMNAHLKDAVALCDVISLMVEEVYTKNNHLIFMYTTIQFFMYFRFKKVYLGMSLK